MLSMIPKEVLANMPNIRSLLGIKQQQKSAVENNYQLY